MKNNMKAAARRGLAALALAMIAGPALAQSHQSPDDRLVWDHLRPSCQAEFTEAIAAEQKFSTTPINPNESFRDYGAGISWFKLEGLQSSLKIFTSSPAMGGSPAIRARPVFMQCMYNARIREVQAGAKIYPFPGPTTTTSPPSSTNHAPVVTAAPPPPSPSQANRAPVTTSAPVSGFTQAQIQQCTNDIAAKQSANATARRNGAGAQADVELYSYQIDLFRGRCAGHPQAALFVSNGQTKLAEARTSLSQSAAAAAKPMPAPQPASNAAPLKPLGTAPPSKDHNPAGEASNCIKLLSRPQFAAMGVKTAVGEIGFYNSCPHKVDITWCTRGQDCNPGYSNLGTVGTGTPQERFSTLPFGEVGQQVDWAACYNGFIEGTSDLFKRKLHACK